MAKRLLDIAFDATMDNIDSYDKDYVMKTFVPIRSRKSEEMWNEAKNHHLHCDGKGNHVDRLWAILPFLINSLKYVQFDTSDLTEMRCKSSTLSNSRFQEFIRCLGSNTPNLKELKIKSPRNLEHSLEERELASIIQLQNLKSLIILNVCVPLSGFMELIRRCKKLESIKVTDVEIDIDISHITFRNKFNFIIINALRRLENNRLGLNLKTTLPNSEGDTRSRSMTKFVLVRKMVAQIGLEQGFEKVTEMRCWSKDLKDGERMDEFPHLPKVKIAHFDCNGTSGHVLRSFLKRNGPNLQELTLEGIDPKANMTFAEIFSSCPNLESLKICDSNLHGNDAPVEAMSRLKQFEWRGLYCEISDPAAFSSILSAPLLEEVFIDLPNINLDDYNTVVNGIRSRKILQNRKKFELVGYDELESNVHVFYNESGFWELEKANFHLIST